MSEGISFLSQVQAYIDQNLTGKLSEENFLIKTNYKTDWGFPWINFRMQLEFAKVGPSFNPLPKNRT